LFELQQAVDSYQFAHRQMQECDGKLETYLAMLPTRVIDVADQPNLQPTAVARKAQKPKKPKGNAPAIDLAAELKRISGVDLTSIDGIDVMGAQTILSELGTGPDGVCDGAPVCLMVGVDAEQRYFRRQSHRAKPEESAKPGGHVPTHVGQYPLKQ